MDNLEDFNYIQTLVYDAEHSAATVEEAYEMVSKWIADFDLA